MAEHHWRAAWKITAKWYRRRFTDILGALHHTGALLDPTNTTPLTVYLLRRWPRAQVVSLCRHLLGTDDELARSQDAFYTLQGQYERSQRDLHEAEAEIAELRAELNR